MQTEIKKSSSMGEQWMKKLGDSYAAPGIALLVVLIIVSVHKQMTLHRSRSKDK